MSLHPRPAAPSGTPIRIEIAGAMRGKGRPRFARRGDFVQTFTDERTKTAENWIRACAVDQAKITAPLDGPIGLQMQITVEIPGSWSKKKQAAALRGDVRPTGKPDLDNSLKLVADALNKVLWRDDAQIVLCGMTKAYGHVPGTVLIVTPIAAQG
jgi:Holliday junction resolvase RusA-like endonuclease